MASSPPAELPAPGRTTPRWTPDRTASPFPCRESGSLPIAAARRSRRHWRVLRALETDADMALGGEVVDFGRPDLLHQADQVGRIRHVAIMQQERHIAGVRIFVEGVDPRGVERG